jgi:hypothetical protein
MRASSDKPIRVFALKEKLSHEATIYMFSFSSDNSRAFNTRCGGDFYSSSATRSEFDCPYSYTRAALPTHSKNKSLIHRATELTSQCDLKAESKNFSYGIFAQAAAFCPRWPSFRTRCPCGVAWISHQAQLDNKHFSGLETKKVSLIIKCSLIIESSVDGTTPNSSSGCHGPLAGSG